MANPFSPAQIDFSQLSQMGQNIGGGIGQHNFGQALAGVPKGQDGSTDYGALMDVVMERRPDLGAKMMMAQGGQGGASVYGTPIYGEDAQGNSVLGVIGKDGSFRQLDTGGVTPTPGVQFRDFGYGQQGFTKGGRPATPMYPNTGAPPTGFLPGAGPGGAGQYMPGTKEATEAGKPQEAKQRVSGQLEDMAYYYMQLKEKGGAVTTERGALGNLPARAGSSAVGQTILGATGSETQSLRNKINQIRPALINSIRQATGMSAKAMDSNVELQFYLQQVGDTSTDVEANLAAIDAIDKQYGLGGVLDKVLPPEVLQQVRNRTGGATSVPRQMPQSPMPPTQASAVTTDLPANINGQELDVIRQAREAIAAGADPQAVMQRLQEMGVRQ